MFLYIYTCFVHVNAFTLRMCIRVYTGRYSISAGGAGGGELPAHKRQSVQYSTLVGPSFLNTSVHAHAHAPIGQTAYLTCIVRNLHNYTVRRAQSALRLRHCSQSLHRLVFVSLFCVESRLVEGFGILISHSLL